MRVIFAIEYRVERRVVVHFHLFVGLHVLAARLDVGQQLLDGLREVDTLGQQHVELAAAGVAVGVGHVGAARLLLHVVDFERQDRQPVDGPGRGLGVEPCVGRRNDVLVLLSSR